MTYPTRDDKGSGYWTLDEGGRHVWKAVGKPRFNWLLLAAFTLNLGVWVGLLAWWIWR